MNGGSRTRYGEARETQGQWTIRLKTVTRGHTCCRELQNHVRLSGRVADDVETQVFVPCRRNDEGMRGRPKKLSTAPQVTF